MIGKTDIVIVGGSFAGLALARALALALAHQVRITLVERQPAGATDVDPRAYALSAGSKRMLETLGVWADLAPHAEPVRAIDITNSALEHAIRPVLISYDNSIGGNEPATWIVEGARLRSALLAAVAQTSGVSHQFQTEVQSFAADGAGVSIALAGGRELRTRLLVAADGRHSPLRDAAGIKTVRWSHPQIGIVTTVAHERPHEGRAVQHFLPGGPFAILPLGGNRSLHHVERREEPRAGDPAARRCRLPGRDRAALRLSARRSHVGGPARALAARVPHGACPDGASLRARRRCRAQRAPHRRSGPQPRLARCGGTHRVRGGRHASRP